MLCLAWSLEYGNAYDLSVPSRRQLLLSWLAAGLISALWIATPCQTFTSARDNPPGPPPLRSDMHIVGWPGLSSIDARAVKYGNLLMHFSALLLSRDVKLEVPVVLENPLQSLLWLAPPVGGLRAHAQTTFNVTEFCGGQRLRLHKSTGFFGYGVVLFAGQGSPLSFCGASTLSPLRPPSSAAPRLDAPGDLVD